MATRVVSSVPHPTTEVFDVDHIWGSGNQLDHKKLLEHFKNEGRVTDKVAIRIFADAAKVLRKEPNVLQVPSPVTIVGDIHGQFFDLLKLFQVGGDPEKTRYLFLGDYVDRGYFSLECILYIFALKICFPDTIHLLRGNHECRHLTEYFTFKAEVEYKNSPEAYAKCMDSFDCLPLAAIMNKQFFCVHGGISPSILTIDDILKVNRFEEPPEQGLLCDLLWSDPHEDFDSLTGSVRFLQNETRGTSFVYTHKAVCDFLDRNNLLSVIRAHEAQDQGYKMYKQNPKTSFPSVITLFSAPNYLDVYNNKAAIMIYADNSMNIKKFSHSPHPYWLPNFMDVFTWSLPFIGEKTTEMLQAVLNVCNKQELGEATDNTDLEVLASKMQDTISHISTQKTNYSQLTKNNEDALLLHGLASPTGEAPKTGSFEDLQAAMKSFEGVKELDKANEQKPTAESGRKARQYRRRQTLEDISAIVP
eukprot:m.20785 g.20785  ORF g.20785 m.20785 type:complete len:474 (+) comp6949_c0_seq1:134-1555(+)